MSQFGPGDSPALSKTVQFLEPCIPFMSQGLTSRWDLGKRKKAYIRRRDTRSTWWYERKALTQFGVQRLGPAREFMIALLRPPQFTALSHVARRLGLFALPHSARQAGSSCGGRMQGAAR